MFKVRKLEKGMMTVEASFLLPLIFFILVLILYFFIFCYENGLASGILLEEIGKAGNVVKTEGNIDTGEYQIDSLNQRNLTELFQHDSEKIVKQCCSNIREKLSRRSLFGTNKEVRVEIKREEISGTIRADIKIPIIGAVETGGFSLFRVEQKVTKTIRIPAEQIRRWQQIE